MRGLGVRVGPLEQGSSAETKEAASLGLSFVLLSGASSSSITGRRRLIEGVIVLEAERECPEGAGAGASAIGLLPVASWTACKTAGWAGGPSHIPSTSHRTRSKDGLMFKLGQNTSSRFPSGIFVS